MELGHVAFFKRCFWEMGKWSWLPSFERKRQFFLGLKHFLVGDGINQRDFRLPLFKGKLNLHTTDLWFSHALAWTCLFTDEQHISTPFTAFQKSVFVGAFEPCCARFQWRDSTFDSCFKTIIFPQVPRILLGTWNGTDFFQSKLSEINKNSAIQPPRPRVCPSVAQESESVEDKLWQKLTWLSGFAKQKLSNSTI